MERDDEGKDSPTGEYAQRTRNIKERADDRNDELELRENARNRQIEHEREIRQEAMRKLIAEAEKMPPELIDHLPAINDWNSKETLVQHGIPDPSDPANPLLFRDASETPLRDLANEAWGYTLSQAITQAAREDERRANSNGTTRQPDLQPPRQTEAEIDADWKLEKANRTEALVDMIDQTRKSHSEELPQKARENGRQGSRETLSERIKREAREQAKDPSKMPQPDRERDPSPDRNRR